MILTKEEVKEEKTEEFVEQVKEENNYVFVYDPMVRRVVKVMCNYDVYNTCTKQDRNELSDYSKLSRCLVKSERYKGLKHCKEDCNNCPYNKEKRETILSLESFMENGIEFEDEQSSVNNEFRNVMYEVEKMSELDRKIIQLVYEGNTDELIAIAINKTLQAVKKRRQRLFEEIRNRLK